MRHVLLVGEFHREIDLERFVDIQRAWGIVDVAIRVLQRRDKKCVDVFLESDVHMARRADAPKQPLNVPDLDVGPLPWNLYFSSGVVLMPHALDPDFVAMRTDDRAAPTAKRIEELMQVDGRTAIPNMTRVHHWDNRVQRVFWVILDLYNEVRNKVIALKLDRAKEMKKRADINRRSREEGVPSMWTTPLPYDFKSALPSLHMLFADVVANANRGREHLRAAVHAFDNGLRLAFMAITEAVQQGIQDPTLYTPKWLWKLINGPWGSLPPTPLLSRGGMGTLIQKAQLAAASQQRAHVPELSPVDLARVMRHPHLLETDIKVFYDLIALKRRADHDNVFHRAAVPTPFSTAAHADCADVPEVMVVYAGVFHTTNLVNMFVEMKTKCGNEVTIVEHPIDVHRNVSILDVLNRLGSSTDVGSVAADVRIGRQPPTDRLAKLSKALRNRDRDRALVVLDSMNKGDFDDDLRFEQCVHDRGVYDKMRALGWVPSLGLPSMALGINNTRGALLMVEDPTLRLNQNASALQVRDFVQRDNKVNMSALALLGRYVSKYVVGPKEFLDRVRAKDLVGFVHMFRHLMVSTATAKEMIQSDLLRNPNNDPETETVRVQAGMFLMRWIREHPNIID